MLKEVMNGDGAPIRVPIDIKENIKIKENTKKYAKEIQDIAKSS